MNAITTILELGGKKHCFLERTNSFQHRSNPVASPNDEILIYEVNINCDEKRKAFFSTKGKCGELVSGDKVEINGLYAEKLGLEHEDPLVLKRIKSTLTSAKKVNVEPLSPDDWEILEQNSGRVERILLNQIRVIWPDQVFPLWIQRSICVFIKITSVEPMSYCLLLENSTEVIVAPKLRSYNPPKSLGISGMPDAPHANFVGPGSTPPMNWKKPSQSKQPATASPSIAKGWFQEEQKSSSHESLDTLEPRPCLRSPSRSPRTSLKKSLTRKRGSFSDPFSERPPRSAPLPKPMLRRESSLMESVMKYVFSFIDKKDDFDNRSESDTSSGIDFSSQNLPSRSGVLRVQPMKLSRSVEECMPKFLATSSLGRNKFNSHLDSTRKCCNQQSDLPIMPYELFQPSTIYVDADSTKIERELHPFLPRLPNNFIARLQRLPSPQEKAAAAQQQGTKPATKDGQDKDAASGMIINSHSLSEDKSSSADRSGKANSEKDITDSSINASCFVRVVVIDRKAALTDEAWKDAADMLLTEQPLMIAHVIVPDLLRRQLKLDTTGSVWLQTGPIDIVIPKKVIVYQLATVPVGISNDILEKAFRAYIRICADADHPLILFQGLFVKYSVLPSLSVEVQVTFFGENDLANPKAVSMLSEQNIDSVVVLVERKIKVDKMGVVNPTLVYSKASDFDAPPPTVKLKHLGGADKVAKLGLGYLQACVGARPLSRETFSPRRGLSHGSLLITGPRGSGKSSLAKAMCRKMAQIPIMAHITLVDCKVLRGKTVAHIQKILETVFDEAAWREPAIIVLDNLDVIMPAPSGPEGEMNAEALYAAKNSQVLHGIIKYEQENNSRVAVIATAASKNSLHPSLVSHNGVHHFQLTLNIGSPDKNIREKILTSILQQHSSVSDETLKMIALQPIASKTEGYVARDLEVLVNRAVHNRLIHDRDAHKEKITLSQDDFDVAQDGFKPVSIRGVALHKAGDLGWDDVGGLEDIKKALQETLMWPAKYPQLFQSCPLRLRSGILLYGAPGTGKTLLAGVVAKECGLNFISIKGPELLNKYIGASEQAVRDIFTRAQSAKPCILFFDEFDSIAPKRGHDSTGVTDRVVNQLLTQLDGVEGLDGVYVLAATSRPDLIDPALLRPGRLDKSLKCSIPTEEERHFILDALTRKMYLGWDVELAEIAAMCNFFTGADIKALLYNAQLNAIHENAKMEPTLDDTALRIKGDDTACPAVKKATQLFKEFESKLSKAKEREKYLAVPDEPLNMRKASGTSEDSVSTEHSTTGMRIPYPMSAGDVSENLKKSLKDALDVERDEEHLTEKDEILESDHTDEVIEPVAMSQNRTLLSRDAILSIGFEVGEGTWPDPETEDEEGFSNYDETLSPVSVHSKSSIPWIPLTSSPLKSKNTNVEEEDDRIELTSPILRKDLDVEDEINNGRKTIQWRKDGIQETVPILKFDPTENEDDIKEMVINKLNNRNMKGSSSMILPDPSLTYPPHSKRKRSYERTQSIPAPVAALDETDAKTCLAVEKPVAVFTSLEQGLASLSPEDEARYLAMVLEIRRRDDRLFEAANAKRRTSLMMAKGSSNLLVEVCQRHLVVAAQDMRPSVTETERKKYDNIYNTFVASRQRDFTKDKVDGPVQQRATLA